MDTLENKYDLESVQTDTKEQFTYLVSIDAIKKAMRGKSKLSENTELTLQEFWAEVVPIIDATYIDITSDPRQLPEGQIIAAFKSIFTEPGNFEDTGRFREKTPIDCIKYSTPTTAENRSIRREEAWSLIAARLGVLKFEATPHQIHEAETRFKQRADQLCNS